MDASPADVQQWFHILPQTSFFSQSLLLGVVKATAKCVDSAYVKPCVNRLFKILRTLKLLFGSMVGIKQLG